MPTSEEIIARYYVGYYNRAPDPVGFEFWLDAYENGTSTLEIANYFADQAETRALYPYFADPESSTPEAFITSIYQNLFDRDPDDAGLEFWTNALVSGGVSTGQMIEAIIGGATTDPDFSVIQDKVDTALLTLGIDPADDLPTGFAVNDSFSTTESHPKYDALGVLLDNDDGTDRSLVVTEVQGVTIAPDEDTVLRLPNGVDLILTSWGYVGADLNGAYSDLGDGQTGQFSISYTVTDTLTGETATAVANVSVAGEGAASNTGSEGEPGAGGNPDGDETPGSGEMPAPVENPRPVDTSGDNLDASALQGLTDPSLAIGLTGVIPFGTQFAFIDLMKTAQGVFKPSEDNDPSFDGSVYLDENGWAREVPSIPGVEATYFFDWTRFSDHPALMAERQGTYTLTYDGEGDIQVLGSANVVSNNPGEIVFTLDSADEIMFWIRINDANSSGVEGNHIRNISLVKSEHQELFDAGYIFNPEWLEINTDMRELRFMDWEQTNNSRIASWDERPKIDDANWSDKGVPIEISVEVANILGADMWVNIPHRALLADDGSGLDYVTPLATYIRDNLDPGLKVTFELSNETWNGLFEEATYFRQLGLDMWPGTSDFEAELNAFSRKATLVAQQIDGVFGAEADVRVTNVIGIQEAIDDEWFLEQVLQAPVWRANATESDPYIAPTDHLDAIAGTSYFGIELLAENSAALADAINSPDVDIQQWLQDYISNVPLPGVERPEGFNPGALFETIESFETISAELARTYPGISFKLYEGGQHIIQNVPGLYQDTADGGSERIPEFDQIERALLTFVNSEQMGVYYAQLWDAWQANGDGPFMQFGDVGLPSLFGSWDLYSSLEDDGLSPRGQVMVDRNSSTPAWWEDRGGEHFQNGLLPDFDAPDGQVYATGLTLSDLAGANLINGTIAEDLIFGGAGNDSLSGFADDDFIIGGEGNDTLSDGFGEDVMSGGSGADVFVLSLDGMSDRIADLEIGIDRIDVSSWGISGFGDLAIRSDSQESTITYAGEMLVVAFVGGSGSLGSSDFVL